MIYIYKQWIVRFIAHRKWFQNYVSIWHVKQVDNILQENMTAYDLIFKAGGVLDEEYNNHFYG